MKDSVVAELAVKAKQGDMQAFEMLYTEFSPLVYSILLEITHDTYEAEDLTQDCFVSALKNIQSLKEPAKAKKWLTAIAANHGKDYLKKKKPALLAPEHEFIFEVQKEENTSVLPEESAVLDERSEEIREIVNSVSEDKRLCLVLFYQHEMSITEISEELGISESAVKSRLFRAREDIREEVEKRSKKGMPLFGVAPLPLILFALRKSSEAASASFSGSAAQTAAFAGVTAASQAGVATVSAAAGASAAGSTATAATGIGAKVAAMSVAQKVVAGVAAASIVTGSAVGATVAVKNSSKAEAVTTTAYVEEMTTAPDYGFEEETVFLPAIAETQASESLTANETDPKQIESVSASQSRAAQAATKNISSTASQAVTEKNATTKTVTTKPVITAKSTTTKQTTAKSTKANAQTTQRPTTTKATATQASPATTKPATTQADTQATVTVTVWGEETSTTKTLYFEAGEQITADEIENKLSDEHGIEAIADDINITAEAGGSYTATAYE